MKFESPIISTELFPDKDQQIVSRAGLQHCLGYMLILASRLTCWPALNRVTKLVLQTPETCILRIRYSVMANLNAPSPIKRGLDESLISSSKRRCLDDNNDDTKMGGTSESDGEELQTSSGIHAQKGKQKLKKRSGRRRRARGEAERAPQFDEEGNTIPKALRYPKRQCALLLGFCGSNYSGMQMCGRDYLSVLWRILIFLSTVKRT